MFGHNYGRISYFQNVGAKKGICACLATKIGKSITIKSLPPLMLCPSLPPKIDSAHVFYKIA